jgi:hypothetical protein
MIPQKALLEINNIAMNVRIALEIKYNTEKLYGKCIEASDILVKELRKRGYNATSHQGYCLYEYFENCTDQPYADHVYTIVKFGNDILYVDVTLDQFQSQFSKQIQKVVILDYIPNFILKRRPGTRTVLQECGWNDYYEGYNYDNRFNYWGNGRKRP